MSGQGEFENVGIMLSELTNTTLLYFKQTSSPFSLGLPFPRSKNENLNLNDMVVNRADIVFGPLIGSGNFGNVYIGKWHSIDVAVKCLHASVENSTKAVEQEAQTMASVLHEHIVKLLAVNISETPMLLVSELMNEGSLLNCLDELVFCNRDLLDILRQVSCAMAYLECEHVLHRDLGAANCLVHRDHPSAPLTIKVADFGLSAALDADGQYASTSGKSVPIRWTAPEALLSKRFSNKSDVWSFGVLAFEVFSLGGEPYANFTHFEVWRFLDSGNRLTLQQLHALQRRDGAKERRSDFDNLELPIGYWNALIDDCWKWKPEDRPNFGDILKLIVAFLE